MVRKLTELKIGESGIVSTLNECDAKASIMEMGILPHTKLTVVNKAPLGGPITVAVSGYYVSIRIKEAEQIFVLQEKEQFSL